MTAAQKLHVFVDDNSGGVTALSPEWQVVEGSPSARTRVHYLGMDRTMLSGYWEASAGKFRVTYSNWEFCHMLSGHCVITPDGGEPVTLQAGSNFILEPGFTGTWEVIEAMTKYFVFRLTNPLPG